jgi:YesN/AraC family two-component response regulator
MGIIAAAIALFSKGGVGGQEMLPECPSTPTLPISADLPKGSETVLVAEDEAIVREHIVLTLTELGYHVVEAADGKEALRFFQETLAGKIDLLLTDIVMPHITGKELAYRVEKLSPQTKIIFCSGYPEKLAARNGMIDPTIPFLQKPVSSRVLAFKIRDVLDAAKVNFDQEVTPEAEHWNSSDPTQSSSGEKVSLSDNEYTLVGENRPIG